MENIELSKILIFGGTGYTGKFMVKASVLLGHKTYVYICSSHHRTIFSLKKTHPSGISIHGRRHCSGNQINIQVLHDITLHFEQSVEKYS
jgi:N-acetyl-gamma-glutamylphosphate reductase